MESEASIKSVFSSLEKLASLKSKSKFYIYTIQIIIGVCEYAVYLLSFIFLFALKVTPLYPTASKSQFWLWPRQIPVLQDYILFLVIFIGLYLLISYQKQFFEIAHERNLSDEIVTLVKIVAFSFLVTIGITFILKNTIVYSRLLLVSFAVAVGVQSSIFRYVRKWTFYQLKKHGKLQQRVLIVGAGKIGRQLHRHILKTETHGFHFLGFLDDKLEQEGVIGSVAELEKTLYLKEVDIIYITIPSEKNKINEVLQNAYKYQVQIRIIPELYDRISSIFEFREDYNYPCLQVVKTPLRGINLLVKRIMDVSLSFIGLLLLTPVFAFIGILIKVDSPGPIFYKQKRIGKNGKPFMMYKFRSMIPDAEQLLNDILEHNEMDGPVFKIKQDPRITKIGAILRRYSLDELPQLINVITGEMSLIGPRPALPNEVERYSNYQWRRMDVRPGMTGLWQVSGRSDLTFEEWIAMDIEYIERWSLGLEFKILLKTIPAVYKGTGAY